MMKTKIKIRFLISVCMGVILGACSFQHSVKVTNLKCMYLESPLGIDAKIPDLSWVVLSEDQGTVQAAYQIIVSSSPQNILKNRGDIWDSGKTESNNSTHIQYKGKTLESGEAYFWKVRAWDSQGNSSPWSETSRWSMGVLDPSDWEAQWISYDHSGSMPLFRKEFEVEKEVEQAWFLISGLGYSECYLNGTKIGDHVLDPAQTNYERYALYSTYDVTESLQIGNNRLGVMLGDGWYNQDKVFSATFSYGKPVLICQLMLKYTDGERVTIASDTSWEWAEGPVVSANVYAGENYDAQKELTDWSKPGGSEGKWKPAIPATTHPPELRAQMLPPIKKMKELSPQNFLKIEDGKYVYDLGQNYAGWVRIKVKEARGTKIKLRMSEEVYPDGTLNVRSTGVYATGFEQIDTYTCKGEGEEIWEPRFTYHGFRYVEVSGLENPPDLETIKGIVVYSSVQQAGSFSCSNENINRLHKMAIWSQISNLHGIPTDCPHREKCGWLGDAHSQILMTIYNFDMEAFWIKYLADIRSSAAREGITLHHKSSNEIFYQAYKEPGIPFMIAPGKRECGAASSDWGTALVQIPWYLYLYYGNLEILREYYPDMKVWVSYLEELAVDHLILEGLGDWCPPGIEGIDCPYELSSTAFYYFDLKNMEQSAKLFHLTEDEDHYKTTRDQVKVAFNARFYNSESHTYGSQTANILALDFGLVPEGDEIAVSDAIVKDMDENHSGYNHTGIFGLSRIFDILARYGHEEVAYRMLGTGGKVSFENMWKVYDATTFWEILPVEDYPDSLRYFLDSQSHNHPMQGAFTAWFYKGIAGIAPVLDHAGFATVKFEPLLVRQLDWAEASYNSPYGEVKSGWKWDQNVFTWDISIPPNSSGVIHLPLHEYASLSINREIIEQGNPLISDPLFIKEKIIKLNSGQYQIVMTK